MFLQKVRSLLGVVVKDLPRYLPALIRTRRAGYLALCNRGERLLAAPNGVGFRCDWAWGSDLHAPKIVPLLGSVLMRRAHADHPVVSAALPAASQTLIPEVSFVIGHRGVTRMPHLLATLGSIAAQVGVSIECIVVEQDTESRLADQLPDWVRLIHTPSPAAEMPYCRSWAFNIGAKHARGELLILHDNDLLVPVDYAAASMAKVRSGYEVVNLKRFLFYLSQVHSEALFSGRMDLLSRPPEAITQNLEGGGSVAITRDGYARIGGMDERFVGWGGEDNEFWERAQSLAVWPYASMPLWHLWHAAQPGKQDTANQTLQLARELSAVDPKARIARLSSLPNGLFAGPLGWIKPSREILT